MSTMNHIVYQKVKFEVTQL